MLKQDKNDQFSWKFWILHVRLDHLWRNPFLFRLQWKRRWRWSYEVFPMLFFNFVFLQYISFFWVNLIRVIGDEKRRVSRSTGHATRVFAKCRLAVSLLKKNRSCTFTCDTIIERIFLKKACRKLRNKQWISRLFKFYSDSVQILIKIVMFDINCNYKNFLKI